MARTITYTNSNNETLTFGVSPYYLYSLVGFDGLANQVSSESSPSQIGSTYLETNISRRPLSFIVVIFAESMSEMETRKRALEKLINPTLGQATLTYNNGIMEKKLMVAIEAGPTMPRGELDRNPTKIRMLVNLIADQPMYEDLAETVIQLADVVPLFEFPLNLPTDLGELSNDAAMVVNSGDVKTPIRVEIPEGVEEPVLTNETTGEFIKVNTTIPAGKTMVINTDFDNKRVVFRDNTTGAETNASQYVDFESDYFELIVGNNQLKFEATSGESAAILSIYYSNRFLGL
jgi:hypothetical protein